MTLWIRHHRGLLSAAGLCLGLPAFGQTPPAEPTTPPAAAAPASPPAPAPTAPAVPAVELPPPVVPVVPPAPPKPRLSPLATAPDWAKLETLSGVMSREEFETLIQNIYSNGADFQAPWELRPDALLVETSPGKPPVRIVFQTPANDPKVLPRYWRTARELPALKAGEPPLTGLHIALDPGHIGGGYATMEERWLSMSPGQAIMEGSLTLQVANMLKVRLEALGALVSLVRQTEAPVTTRKPQDFLEQAKQALADAGITAPKETYNGIVGEAKVATIQWQEEKLFYRVSEIRARAKRVNEELKPDITVCLHLNAEEWGDPQKPAFSPKNHFHLLINGCYSSNEMHLEDVRFEMLNRLFNRTHEEEKMLGDTVADVMADITGLPPFVYPQHNARRVTANPYVWARNLLASRLYQCPVIYLEPYVMNNEMTYKRLLLGQYVGRTLLDRELVTSPLEDYARSVAKGLETYYKKARNAQP